MIRFAFKKGLRFREGKKSFTLLRRLANGNLQLEDPNGELTSLSDTEIHCRWRAGTWEIDETSLGTSSNVFYFTTPKDLSVLPEAHQAEAKRRLHYLQSVLKAFQRESHRLVSTKSQLAPKIREASREIGDESPPSTFTFWRWWRAYARTKCVLKLVKRSKNAGRSEDPVLRSIFDEVVCEVFLTPQKLPGKAVVEAVKNKIQRINLGVSENERLQPPSPATIYRWLKTLANDVVKRSRDGHAATAKELRSVVGAVKVEMILDRVEIDHTPLDIVVICETTRLILGRPWLTLAIDRFSRMIVGFYISFHAPSATSVLHCLRMMIMPKDDILKKFSDVAGPWPAHGFMDALVMDNGMDLHADAVEAICLEMGIELQFCGVAYPEMKGGVERAIGTLNRSLIHTLPGTTFSSVQQRGDYASEKHAAIDLQVLTHVLIKWIVDVYHKTPHRGLAGHTPLAVWQAAETKRVIELPAHPRQLDTIVGHSATRTIFHYGIEYDNLRYNSPLLQAIRQRDGNKAVVRMRAFEDDVGRIAVFDPHLDEYIDVPAVDKGYAGGVNRYVHRLVCAQARKRHGDQWSDEQLRAVKHEIQEIVAAAVKAKKAGVRKLAAVALKTDSEQVLRGGDCDALARAAQQQSLEARPPEPLDPGLKDELPRWNSSDAPKWSAT